jgi:hypothetical protein
LRERASPFSAERFALPGKNLWATLVAVALLIVALPAAVSASTIVTTSHGTWTASPGQSTTYQASVQQPINADGSSNFKANGKAVIPVKFALASGTGAFVFQSIFSDSDASNDASSLKWTSATSLTFADIAELSAVYAFEDGNCAGGSLRWTVRLNDGGTNRNLDIHYQPGADGIGQQTCAAGTSGQNLIGSSDTIYVIQQFNATHPGAFDSLYNTTYADAVAELGSLPVVSATLIVDSGWGANGDQVVNLTSATVAAGGSTPYTETFTPQPASAMTTVCPTASASITITKVDGAPSGDVNEPLSVQPQDNNGLFRIVDCKYMYNLATSSLSGVGTYTVKATIGSTTFTVGTFDLK